MIHVGDRVGFLDETGKGTVIHTDGKTAIVLTDEGLEIPYPVNKLVNYTQKNTPVKKKTPAKEKGTLPEPGWEDLSPKPVIKKVTDLTFRYDPLHDGHSREKKRSVKRSEETWEIDLHIQELTEDWRGLSNAEILHIQMQKCRLFLEHCMEGRIRRAVIIHGVGTGKLKQEICMYLDRFTQLHYYDAPYQKYGQGATEVEFFYGTD